MQRNRIHTFVSLFKQIFPDNQGKLILDAKNKDYILNNI